ncbi:MAG TPA: hypothetical protein VFQ80_01600 [Thermomicrobiales bacterium]|nr:hypothetical protein [Thermomicrobiales bacterium]
MSFRTARIAAGENITAPEARDAPRTRAAGIDRVGRIVVWIAYGVFVALSLRAPLLRTGDAQQYVAMADALAHLRPPSFSPAEVAAFKAWLANQPAASFYPDAVNAIDQGNLRAGGRQEFSHFWLYPLAAAPFVRAVEAVGLHPGYGLFVANALLLAGALVALGRTARPTVSLLLLASPALWFVNKAQVEIFTFSLLTIAICLAIRRRYLLAALAAAVAATQNLPIAAAVPLFWAIGAWRSGCCSVIPRRFPAFIPRRFSPVMPSPPPVIPSEVEGSRPSWTQTNEMPRQARHDGERARHDCGMARHDDATLVGLTIAVCLLHPTYYLWRLGVVTPQALNHGFGLSLPDWERYLAVLVDPDIGLFWWAPLIPLFTVVGAVSLGSRRLGGERRADLGWAALAAAILGGWFLLTFAQTTNINSGGTMSMSRYAMWLLPLAIPFLAAAAEAGAAANLAMLAAGIVALPLAVILFEPAQPERYVAPTAQAAWLIDWLPGRYRQTPEIFYERQSATDGGVRGSAASRGCQTVLLSRTDQQQPCPLTAGEQAAAHTLFDQGWSAVWITRPGFSGWGAAGVAGAVRDGS